MAINRRRSRSEISAISSDDEGDDFYDADEYTNSTPAVAALTSGVTTNPTTAATTAHTATSTSATTTTTSTASESTADTTHATSNGISAAATATKPTQPATSTDAPLSLSPTHATDNTTAPSTLTSTSTSTPAQNTIAASAVAPVTSVASPTNAPATAAAATTTNAPAMPSRPPRPTMRQGSGSSLVSPATQPRSQPTQPISPATTAQLQPQPTAASASTATVHPPLPQPPVSSVITNASSSSSSTAPDIDQPFIIKNLDTGEVCDLSVATKVFPEVAQAMTLQQFEQAAALKSASGASASAQAATATASAPEDEKEKKKTLGFLSRIRQALHLPHKSSDETDGKLNNSIKVKVKHRSYAEFTDMKLVQTLIPHSGPIWTTSISALGDFVASGGQDSIVRVWAVMGSTAAKELDERLRAQKSAQEEAAAASAGTGGESDGGLHAAPTSPTGSVSGDNNSPTELPNFEQYLRENGCRPVVYPVPFRSYAGHKADVIDLAWSKANFLLSASIDKTVRLWHVSRQKCLCVFQHADFVTAVAFHPIEDRYFVSGSFDKKLRIWNIPEHRVVEWAQTSNIITAATFNPNGNMTVAGLYNGQAVFYQTDGLKYHTQVDAKNRHGKNRKGKKVTGMQFSPDGRLLLVTTNDSRIRLYDMDDFSMVAKFKGAENDELQIRAWFSPDGKHVICGSENHHVYIWSAAEYYAERSSANSNAKPEVKCDASESFRAFGDTCTSAQFMPYNTIRLCSESEQEAQKVKDIIVAAGYDGSLKFFSNTGSRKQL